jgi:hypothetical protein
METLPKEIAICNCQDPPKCLGNKKRQQLDTRVPGSRITNRPSAVFDLETGNFEPQNKKRVSIYLPGIVFFGSD